jgi:hypothetical protein
MFYDAKEFDQDISAWNVGPTTTQGDMFRGATCFSHQLPLPWTIQKDKKYYLIDESYINCTSHVFYQLQIEQE